MSLLVILQADVKNLPLLRSLADWASPSLPAAREDTTLTKEGNCCTGTTGHAQKKNSIYSFQLKLKQCS